MSANRDCVTLAVLALASACAPDLNTKASRVEVARVVGVRAEPAEARPGQTVTWSAVVVSPDGIVASAPVEWGLCIAPRGPTDSISVSATCLGDDSQTGEDGMPLFIPIEATGIRVKGAVPADACAKIGPQLPPVNKDGDPQRAPEADITGGYQLPLRTFLVDGDVADTTFYRQRIKCNLANSPAEVAREYAARYVLNTHPAISGLEIEGNALGTNGKGAADVPEGGRYTMTVRWEDTSVESYVRVNPQTRTVEELSENLDVTWFTNGGVFERDRTTPGSDGLSSDNQLILTPGRTDAAVVWVLLHDDRGGLAFTTVTFNPI